MTDSVAVGRRSFVAPLATCAVGLLAMIGGPFAAESPIGWPEVATATAVAIVAQFAALRVRQGIRTVYFAWGEASLIIVVFLVPAGWVPLVIGVGFAAGHGLFLLRTNTRWTVSKTVNIATLAICGAAGAATVHAIRTGNRDDITPRLIVALILGGIVYFIVSSLVVNANSRALGILSTSLQSAISRTVVDKLPMVAGNVTVGILVVVLLARDRMWLLLVPPVAVLMHQAYVYRSRIADERRLWRDFADIAGSLNQLDERSVAVAALTGTLRLFRAESAEIWVDRSPEQARGYRGRSELNGVDIMPLTSTTAPASAPPDATRALTIGGQRVGDLRVWMPVGSSLDSRDHMALSAVADALASALHDALAHNALAKLAARSLQDSYQDVLTGVANRSSLLTEGADKLRAGGRTPVVLYVVGINRFKEVNDTLGPTAGDDLLRITAGRLAAFAGATDLVARVGGDEFAILSEMEGVADPLAYATTHARCLAEELTVATDLAGLQVAVEVSVGVAVGRADEFDIAELVRRSGIAMRRAKRGAGAIAVFDASDTTTGSVDRLSVLVDLREAMEHDDQLVLAVQPAVALATGQPIAVETLIRWNHPRRGVLVPRDFVDLVDQSDLVMPFTRYVLDRALRLADEWCRAGMPMRVSVNLSPRSLSDPNLPGDVTDLLKRYGVEPKMLTLEITESAVLTGQPIVAETLAALRAHGVQLAVDDFGSGFSSLTFLARVQVDEVKVDSTFVAAMTESAEAAAIVRTTVDLGRRLGVRVVAEGVETPAQRSALEDLGCFAAQGRHITPPVRAEDALEVLHELSDAANAEH
ncbi:MAG TPA: bifunctional diguanylate cyclase/phosphodiesterase [Micromonosporaceae bacterium]